MSGKQRLISLDLATPGQMLWQTGAVDRICYVSVPCYMPGTVLSKLRQGLSLEFFTISLMLSLHFTMEGLHHESCNYWSGKDSDLSDSHTTTRPVGENGNWIYVEAPPPSIHTTHIFWEQLCNLSSFGSWSHPDRCILHTQSVQPRNLCLPVHTA